MLVDFNEDANMILRIKALMKIIIVFFLIIFLALILLNSSWFSKMFYPKPHQEIVVEESKQQNIDENLIYAIIKTESKFKEDAISNKGAMGLMQIMPETGKWISQELDIDSYNKEQLLKAETNLKMGIWYYTYLINQFDDNSIAAIAAYNGGETNVNKWIKEELWSGQEIDLENIPFKETREYVIRVLANYERYETLYKN